MKTDSESLRERLKLFIDFQNSYDRFLLLKSKIVIAPNTLEVLNEIETASAFIPQMKKRAEEESLRHEEEKEQKRQRRLAKNMIILLPNEEDMLIPHAKLYQCKRATNPTCFGQRSMNTLSQMFNGKDEMKIMCNKVKYQMKKVIEGAFYFGATEHAIDPIEDGKCILLSQTIPKRETKVKKTFINPMFSDYNQDLNQIKILANDNIIQSYKQSVMKTINATSRIKLPPCNDKSKKVSRRNNHNSINTQPTIVNHNQMTKTQQPIKLVIKPSKAEYYSNKLDKELFGYRKSNQLYRSIRPAISKHFDYSELFTLRTFK